MKLIEQISARMVLINHANERLPIQLGYKIAMYIRASENDAKFYQQKLDEILEEFAAKDPDGKFLHTKDNNIVIQNGKVDECKQRVKELEMTEVNPIALEKFEIRELAPIQFTADELLKLFVYINE